MTTPRFPRPLKDLEIPLPARGPRRRELSPAERAMNARLFGDPDPARLVQSESLRQSSATDFRQDTRHVPRHKGMHLK